MTFHPHYPPRTILRRHTATGWEDYRVTGSCQLGMFQGITTVSLGPDGAARDFTLNEAAQLVAVGRWEPDDPTSTPTP